MGQDLSPQLIQHAHKIHWNCMITMQEEEHKTDKTPTIDNVVVVPSCLHLLFEGCVNKIKLSGSQEKTTNQLPRLSVTLSPQAH